MRIIGRRDLQDYFDHVGHRFGQDLDVVYVRSPLKVTSFPVSGRVARYLHTNYLNPQALPHAELSFVVAAKWFFPAFEIPAWEGGSAGLELLDPVKHERWLTKRTRRSILLEHYEAEGDLVLPEQPPEDVVVELVRAVGVPIFRVVGLDWTHSSLDRFLVQVATHLPHLGRLGVAARVPAEQMWQEVYATLSNVLRRDPDKEPPCTIANDDRVEAAGFDLKSSFRHPVNIKKT